MRAEGASPFNLKRDALAKAKNKGIKS